MDKQALYMAIFMGLYVPLFTGISVTIHHFIRRKPQQKSQIIVVHRQFESQSFKDASKTSIFKLDKSQTLAFSQKIKDAGEVESLSFYKFLLPAYTRDNNLLQKFDFNKITIDESLVNLQTISPQQDS